MNNLRIIRLKVSSVIMVLLLLNLSCKKQVAGPQGDPGTPGEKGNLKQKSFSPIKVPSSNWTLVNPNQWDAVIFLPEISRDVVEKGQVVVYMDVDGNGTWYAMPYSSKRYIFHQYDVENGMIHLHCYHTHSGEPDKPEDRNYKVVLFSPS